MGTDLPTCKETFASKTQSIYLWFKSINDPVLQLPNIFLWSHRRLNACACYFTERVTPLLIFWKSVKIKSYFVKYSHMSSHKTKKAMTGGELFCSGLNKTMHPAAPHHRFFDPGRCHLVRQKTYRKDLILTPTRPNPNCKPFFEPLWWRMILWQMKQHGSGNTHLLYVH